MDLKLVARTWHKYPNAAIGISLPASIIVIDCDVKKDENKRPVMADGHLVHTGLKSFQEIILDIKTPEDGLNTLSQDTQSGGRQFFYLMPEGVSSFNHTGIMPGLDIKGYGGYVIAPISTGKYGSYRFRNLSQIRPIPSMLLQRIIDIGKSKGGLVPTRKYQGTAIIKLERIIEILNPYWDRANGKRNEFMLSIAGFIARAGGSESDARYIVSRLSEITGKGMDHVNGTKYAFRRKGPLKGYPSIERLMEELGNDEE
jgi:hypothetical protein